MEHDLNKGRRLSNVELRYRMILLALLACSPKFPCTPDQLLSAEGACIEQVTPTDSGTGDSDSGGSTLPVDADGDGVDSSADCDDSDDTVFPGAVESRDGRDEDCDGAIDEDVPSLLFDLAERRHEVSGLGANVWADSEAWVAPVTTLGGTVVRAGLGPVWDTTGVAVPLGGSSADYDAYVAAAMTGTLYGNLAAAVSTADEIERLGLDLVLLNWEAPSAMESSGVLRTEYVADYAHLIAALVGHLSDNGVSARWLEVTNEPDGNWNTYVYPSDYADLVTAVRADLDARDITETEIAGPGLAYLAQDGVLESFLDALTPEALAAIGAWSAHGYDDVYAQGDGPEVFADAVADFSARTREIDPTLRFLLTETASQDPEFYGTPTNSPLTCGDWSETEAYGIRLLAYSLRALGEGGASAVLPWQAADPDWGGLLGQLWHG